MQQYYIDTASSPTHVLIKDEKGNVLMSLYKGLDVASILKEFKKNINLKGEDKNE